MGFTGSLALGRTSGPLIDLMARPEAELIGRRDDWQLAAVVGDVAEVPGRAAALVEDTAAPVLIAVIDDSDTALLVADSPGGHRWVTVLNAPDRAGRAAVADTTAMTAIAKAALAWAAEAGHTLALQPVLDALCAVDVENRAVDRAWAAAAGDVAAMSEIVRHQVSFIEVYVLRVLAALKVAVPVQDPASWWAHLANQAYTPSPYPGHLPTG